MGMIPARLTSPTVGLMPTIPLAEDGQTIEPTARLPVGICNGRAAKPIRNAALWDGKHRTVVAIFNSNVAMPQLADGQVYVLAVDLADGVEWKMLLRASAAAETDTVIVMVR